MLFNPQADCAGHSAGDRAKWLVDNRSLSIDAAQQHVMDEFPACFRSDCSWNPDAMCDGYPASGRLQWCVDKCGLSHEAAKQRVMNEFPSCFQSGRYWNPDTMCDGHSAGSRLKWCVERDGLSHEAAKQRIMDEFPAQFPYQDATSPPSHVAALGGVSHAASELITVAPADPEMLVWSDEFDYTGPPDPTKWAYETGGGGWGNRELQYYTNDTQNAWVSNGSLRIRALRKEFGGHEFTSARLLTRGKADWLYGRIEVRLKVPMARGSWPAAWMMPSAHSFGAWPKSGEIDIMEHVGLDPGSVHGTVHTDKFNHTKKTQAGRVVRTTAHDWHTYGVEWSPERIRFIVDGRQYHVFQKESSAGWEAWPFDHRFYLILNVAVGGDWGGQKGIDRDAFLGDGQVMEVAWARVYRLR